MRFGSLTEPSLVLSLYRLEFMRMASCRPTISPFPCSHRAVPTARGADGATTCLISHDLSLSPAASLCFARFCLTHGPLSLLCSNWAANKRRCSSSGHRSLPSRGCSRPSKGRLPAHRSRSHPSRKGRLHSQRTYVQCGVHVSWS